MKKILGIVGILVACAIVRLIPHAANVAPMTALALFSGYTISSRWGFLLAPLATFATDIIIGFYDVRVMVTVYTSYALIALLGFAFQAGRSSVRAITATFAGSLIFFTLTNFAVWAFGAWYAKSPEGLLSAYVNGLPFLRNSLLGDMGYGALFYSGYAAYRARASLRLHLKNALSRNKNIIVTR
jgi:hypothetical protein